MIVSEILRTTGVDIPAGYPTPQEQFGSPIEGTVGTRMSAFAVCRS
jgi:hypothetical protein